MFGRTVAFAPALKRTRSEFPLPIVGPSAQGEHPKLGNERSINWYIIKPESDGGPWVLRGRPGLLGLSELPRAPMRGWYVHKDRLFIVAMERIYEIFDDGTPSEWGRINTATGRVVMASLLDTIIIGDGTGFYALDLETGEVAGIADAPRGTFCVFFRQRILYQGENGQVFYSEVNDPTNVPGLNFFTAESLPDDIVAMTTTEANIWLHGSSSTEPWYNSGDVDNPFQPIDGGSSFTGCEHPHTALQLDGSIWMVGKDKNGASQVVRSNGTRFSRVSTSTVERWLKEAGEVTALSYQEDGHTFYQLNSLDNTGAPSWALDIGTGEWTERAWLNRKTGVQERQRAEFHAYCYGQHMVGDYANGKIYRQGLDLRSDDGQEIRRTRVTQRCGAKGKSATLEELWLDFATGVGIDGTGQGTDPLVMLRVSPDGVRYSDELVCRLGSIGEYDNQVRFFDLGLGREWVLEISVSDPVFTGLMGGQGVFIIGRR